MGPGSKWQKAAESHLQLRRRAEVTFASSGWAGGSETPHVSSPASGGGNRCVHRYCNPPTPTQPSCEAPLLPPQSHTNGVLAWLVNRADCSHLAAFRFKYLSASWWAKSALTVRLLFKVADRRLGERRRERGKKKGPFPRCWNGIHFHVFIFCHGRVSSPPSTSALNSRICQATSAPAKKMY